MDGIQLQYVHITRDGGERVFMNNPPGGPMGAASFSPGIKEPRPDPVVYGELTRRMMQLNEKPMEVVYQPFQGLAGFRIVHARENGEISGLVFEKEQLYAGINIAYKKPIEWHKVEADRIAEEFEFRPPDPLNREFWRDFRIRDDDAIDLTEGPLAGKRLWPGTREKDNLDGLWVIGLAGAPELLVPGDFASPVLCAGGEWIVTAKSTDTWAVPNGVVRINLRTKRLFPVDLPMADNFNPLAWVDAHKRVLLYRQRDEQDGKAGPREPEFHLLDPVTGDHRRVEGEFRPLRDIPARGLQPTGKPSEFWAIVRDRKADQPPDSIIGRYDTSQFRFTPIQKLNGIRLKSSDIWVDEKAEALWLSVNGDLLRLSLPHENK
jgi:hypothetical protein